jgi:protein-S-isoprenylcysteine O-methyltransferase Ste14
LLGLAWTTLGDLLLFLAAFASLGRLASRAAGRSVWLFGAAQGPERLAALAFRAAFMLAVLGSFAAAAWPELWVWRAPTSLAIVGHLIAVAGAMLAVAAQAAMGTSWRVGVQKGATGALVMGGLFDLSRNPTFVGQGGLLAGVALALPSWPTVLALLLFALAAHLQVRSEERTLEAALGEPYRAYQARVPRWFGRPAAGGVQ